MAAAWPLALYLGRCPDGARLHPVRRGLEHIGAGETATLTLAEPVTAVALGFAVLGERPGAAALAGAALVLAGLALLALRAERRLVGSRARAAEAAA